MWWSKSQLVGGGDAQSELIQSLSASDVRSRGFAVRVMKDTDE